jgi:hypothetical protein
VKDGAQTPRKKRKKARKKKAAAMGRFSFSGVKINA